MLHQVAAGWLDLGDVHAELGEPARGEGAWQVRGDADHAVWGDVRTRRVYVRGRGRNRGYAEGFRIGRHCLCLHV